MTVPRRGRREYDASLVSESGAENRANVSFDRFTGGPVARTRRSGLARCAKTVVPVTLNQPAPRNKRASSPWTTNETDEARHEPGTETSEMFVDQAGSSTVTRRGMSERISRRAVGSSWAVIVTRYPAASKIGPRAAADRAGGKPSMSIDSRNRTGARPSSPMRDRTVPVVALYPNCAYVPNATPCSYVNEANREVDQGTSPIGTAPKSDDEIVRRAADA